jgi:predicted Zn-dependent protease
VKFLQKAIALRPADPVLLGNFGGLLTEANDPLAAIGPLREAIRLKPDQLDAVVNLGVAYQTSGRLEDARKQFEKVLKRQPAHPRALIGLAMLEQASGDRHAAIEGLRKLRKYYPRETVPLVQILYTEKVTAGLAELQEAERRLRETTVRDRPALLYAIAKAYDDLNRFDDAMARLLEAKKNAPPFDIEAHRRDCDTLKAVLTRDFIHRRRDWGATEAMFPCSS